MGISHADFWNMTFQEILNAHRGYTERIYNDWRRTRWLGAIIANAFGNGKRTIKPSDLMKLPGDDGADGYEDDIKRLKEARKKWQTEH